MIPCEGTPPKRSLALGCAGADPSRAAGRSTTAAPHFGRGVASRGAPLVHRLPVGPAAGCAARWLWVAAGAPTEAKPALGPAGSDGPVTGASDRPVRGELEGTPRCCQSGRVRAAFATAATCRNGTPAGLNTESVPPTCAGRVALLRLFATETDTGRIG